jgi:multicomponent K+:H+ antiporter subunit G
MTTFFDEASLPQWVEAIVALLVVMSGLLALLGSFGLVRLSTFFERIHAPTLGSTLGTWSMTAATAVFFSFQGGLAFVHAVLISIFIVLSAPITNIFLMRAALFRDRAAGRDVPPSLSN